MLGYISSTYAPYSVLPLYHKPNLKQPAIDILLGLDSDLWEGGFDHGKLRPPVFWFFGFFLNF